MQILLVALALLIIIFTFLPVLRREAWWIRIFDFPRLQVAALGILILAGHILYRDPDNGLQTVLIGALAASVLYLGLRMAPYTPLWVKQVQSPRSHGGAASVSILISNLLMENRRFEAMKEIIERFNPDIILTVEADRWWADRLADLVSSYPFAVEHPLENTYGMVLRSRLRPYEEEVRFLVEEDVPSIRCRFRLSDRESFLFYGLHPRPPGPSHATETTPRDAELLIVGREVRAEQGPIIVAGDLNDVAWSHTTRLFQRISGLLDPRRGRGMFNTYHASIPLIRWPLDHVFHSRHFRLERLLRLPNWGSDHFPVLVTLALEAETRAEQELPAASEEDRAEAVSKIDRALNYS